MKAMGPAGIRWQQVITPGQAQLLRGKTLVFIGLGNSTAEMMVQCERYRRQGIDINYRVLTHYPRRAIEHPDSHVEYLGKPYRVFRDLSKPQLTKFEGDIPEVRAAYWYAMAKGWIIPEVTQYLHNRETHRVAYSNDPLFPPDVFMDSVPCDQLYTLIGYGQDPEFLSNCGMYLRDRYTGAFHYDYDGEVQREPGITGRRRVYPGYFALGAVLKTPENPNAVVIPGIMHRLYDLAFMAAIRGLEYAR
jgi:hypothetical protein